MLYSNRMEVENHGGLYGRITVDELGKMSADTRNPFIAGGLEVLLGTENRFSGIPTIIHEMKKAGLPPAVFESKRGVFKVTLYNYRSESRDKTILNGTMREIIAYCTEPRSRNLRPLLDMGLLEMTMPDKPKSKNQKYVAVEQ